MIRLTKNLEEAQFVTHAGNFHADDVFSTVLLSKLFSDVTLIRLSEYHDDATKLAYDIGLGKFDHHGPTYDKKRKNGIHYCSFGLLWQEYGQQFLKNRQIANFQTVFDVLDELLVIQIDAIDNGEYNLDAPYNIYTLSTLIEQFRPKYGQKEDEDECFLKAVTFADLIFEQILNDAISKVQTMNIIYKKSTSLKDKILILDEYLPYEYAIFKLGLDIDFVVYPSNRGGYAAHTVPTKYKGFTPKIPFNKNWAGLRDAELQKVSKVKTAKFCHRNLFLATAQTKEDALKLIYETKKDALSASNHIESSL